MATARLQRYSGSLQKSRATKTKWREGRVAAKNRKKNKVRLGLFSTAWQNLQHDWWFSPNLHESNITTINLCFGAPVEVGFLRLFAWKGEGKVRTQICFSYDPMDSYSLYLNDKSVFLFQRGLLGSHRWAAAADVAPRSTLHGINYWSTGRQTALQVRASFHFIYFASEN